MRVSQTLLRVSKRRRPFWCILSPMARPSSFTIEIGEKICAAVSEGSNLTKLCTTEGFPSIQNVYNWFKTQPQFFEDYARARELRASIRASRIDDYCEMVKAGELDANAARVIIDAEKWQAAHEQPKVYGDRIQNQLTGADGETLKIVVTGVEPTKDNT